MTDSYEDVLRKHRRLLLLELLSGAGDYKINEMILRQMVGTRLTATSKDLLRSELQWLEEQGLITIEKVEDLWITKVVQRGLDVVSGAAKVPGITKPGPGQ